MKKVKSLLSTFLYYAEKFGICYPFYAAGYHYLKHFSPYFQYKCSLRKKQYYKELDSTALKAEVEMAYYIATKKHMDLNNPVTLNEKIQWLKIHDITPLKESTSDKYLARAYVEEHAGKEHMVKLLGIYSDFAAISFEKLPSSFVIKSTQGSGFNYIVKDKNNFNFKRAKYCFKYWLKTDYRYLNFEYQYANIPQIVIEEYLGESLLEYKFMCFQGEPRFFWIRSAENGRLTRNYFDMNRQEIAFHFENVPKHSSLPYLENEIFFKMVDIVKKLSSPFKFVRIDTFVTKNQFYIGELTFTTGAGYDPWEPEADAIKYGNMISLEAFNDFISN